MSEVTTEIYTDGACVGNPGPAGIGAVFICGDVTKVMAAPIGESTNNISELRAIKDALFAITNRDAKIKLFSDSQYAVYTFTKNWKSKKNKELIKEMRELIGTFSNLELNWVRGHNGHKWNELSDHLSKIGVKLSKQKEQRFKGPFKMTDLNIS